MKGIIERAFELARNETCRTLSDIRRTLVCESYSAIDAHLAGAAIRRQLKALMRSTPSLSPEPNPRRVFKSAKGEKA